MLQARQTFAQRKTWKPASHQTKPMKNVLGTPLRNCSLKNPETLLLDPTLRKVRLGSLQATRPNSRKRCLGRACEKAEPQQVLCPSHCETAAGKMPKRRFWNPLKQRNSAQAMRNRSQKDAETLLLEPTKNKEKKLPQARQTFAQRKTWKPASHQTKPMKNVLGTPLRNCSLKNPETLLLEPTKKTFQSFGNRCRQLSRKACARCLWRSGSDRLTQRKKSHGGAPSSSPPPFDHNLLQQLPRRAPPHSDEGSADFFLSRSALIYTARHLMWCSHCVNETP